MTTTQTQKRAETYTNIQYESGNKKMEHTNERIEGERSWLQIYDANDVIFCSSEFKSIS